MSYNIHHGTVMVLEKNGDRLTVEVINAAGEKLLQRDLTN